MFLIFINVNIFGNCNFISCFFKILKIIIIKLCSLGYTFVSPRFPNI